MERHKKKEKIFYKIILNNGKIPKHFLQIRWFGPWNHTHKLKRKSSNRTCTVAVVRTTTRSSPCTFSTCWFLDSESLSSFSRVFVSSISWRLWYLFAIKRPQEDLEEDQVLLFYKFATTKLFDRLYFYCCAGHIINNKGMYHVIRWRIWNFLKFLPNHQPCQYTQFGDGYLLRDRSSNNYLNT